MTEPLEDCTRQQTAVADRITILPESVLVHILSLLPIQDAIKTEVLSKRWQFLWTYFPSLLFRHRDLFSHRATNKGFVAFVEKTLFLCSSSNVKKFGVDFEYQPRYASKINSWIRFATGKGVEELSLEFFSAAEDLVEDSRYKLPQLLYTNSSFKRLRFSLCNVMPQGIVAWNSLKELSVGAVRLSDDVVEKILEGSPVLEMLEFYYYGGFSRLHLGNTGVKKLILREFWNGEGVPDDSDLDSEGSDSEEDESGGEHDDSEEEEDDGQYNYSEEDESEDEHSGEEDVFDWDAGAEDEVDGEHDSEELELSAPYLQSLEISGRIPRNCKLRTLSSLVDASFDCDLDKTFVDDSDDDDDDDKESIHDFLSRLLESLVHVKRLTLGSCAAQVLLDMEAKGLSSRLLKCKCPTLHAFVNKSDLDESDHGVTSMFKNSQNFETLFMTVSSTENIEADLPHSDRRERPDHLVSVQGLLDEILAKLHHLRAEHECPEVQLDKLRVLLSEIQAGQQQQYGKLEHLM